MSRVVVLLSGGIDSTVVLAQACVQHGADNVHAVSVDYGQRHDIELLAAKRVAATYGVKHSSLKIELPAASPLLRTGVIAEDPTFFVPGRNLVLLALAAAHAQSIGALEIHIGANADDYRDYPDCRERFLEAVELAVYTGGKNTSLIIEAPLVHLTKREVVILGRQLGVDFGLTHSCYDPQPQPCELCAACKLRREALLEN